MFFTRFWFYVLGLLPVHGRLPRYLRVVLGYYDCKDELIAWHLSELEKMDAIPEKAIAKRIDPMDPRYPPIFSRQQITELGEAMARLLEAKARLRRPKIFR